MSEHHVSMICEPPLRDWIARLHIAALPFDWKPDEVIEIYANAHTIDALEELCKTYREAEQRSAG